LQEEHWSPLDCSVYIRNFIHSTVNLKLKAVCKLSFLVFKSNFKWWRISLFQFVFSSIFIFVDSGWEFIYVICKLPCLLSMNPFFVLQSIWCWIMFINSAHIFNIATCKLVSTIVLLFNVMIHFTFLFSHLFLNLSSFTYMLISINTTCYNHGCMPFSDVAILPLVFSSWCVSSILDFFLSFCALPHEFFLAKLSWNHS
jgi:hypothetical protein